MICIMADLNRASEFRSSVCLKFTLNYIFGGKYEGCGKRSYHLLYTTLSPLPSFSLLLKKNTFRLPYNVCVFVCAYVCVCVYVCVCGGRGGGTGGMPPPPPLLIVSDHLALLPL